MKVKLGEDDGTDNRIRDINIIESFLNVLYEILALPSFFLGSRSGTGPAGLDRYSPRRIINLVPCSIALILLPLSSFVFPLSIIVLG